MRGLSLAALVLAAVPWSVVPVAFGQWDDDQAFRNELEIARSAVQNLEEAVRSSRREAAAKRQVVEEHRARIEETRRDLERVNELIEVKSRARDLVERQLRRKIRRLEADLQKAVDERRPAEELKAIQRRTDGYRRLLKETVARYAYPEQLAGLARQRRQLEARVNGLDEAIEEPLDQLAFALQCLRAEEASLEKARDRLADLRLEAPEKLAQVGPAYLDRVTITGPDGSVVYLARWEDATRNIDTRIRILRRAIEEQERTIATDQDVIDAIIDIMLEQNRECDRLMEDYRDALWWQALKTIGTELVDSAVNILLDWKEMGPYAFLVEAIDVVQQSIRGKKTADYGLPSGALDRKYFGDVALETSGKKIRDHVGEKGAVKDLINACLMELSGGSRTATGAPREIGKEYVREGIRVRRLLGEMKTLADIKYVLRWKNLKWAGRVVLGEVKKAFDTLADPRKLLDRTTTKIDKMVDRNFGASLAMGVLNDYAKEQFRQERLQAWLRYTKAAARRAVMHRALLTAGVVRADDQETLAEMREVLDDLMAERDQSRRLRRLVVDRDGKLEFGQTFALELEFTLRDIEVTGVTVGGIAVEATGQDGARWRGSLRLEAIPSSGELRVEARDRDSGRVLDDPSTMAHYDAGNATWRDYEPGPDRTHTLRLGEVRPLRSLVLLIDCSGSMEENDRMRRARAGARHLFSSGRIKPTDEVALYVFRGGRISRPVSFTLDHEIVLTVIDSLSPDGGTPLAEAIVQAGTYLHLHGRARYRALVVLTDGEASDVGQAVRTVRDMSEAVRMLLKR